MKQEDYVRLNQIQIQAEMFALNLDQYSMITQLAKNICHFEGVDPDAGYPNWRKKVMTLLLEDAMLQEIKRVTTTQG
jgi:hypothetical protein